MCKNWLCSQSLVTSLAPTKFYISQNQYFPTENIPPLEADASLLDLSSKGRCSLPVMCLETWEKRARKLVAINSHADLFSSTAYLCLQQQSMSVAALSRLLEVVAKSIKHATAMSSILATELFQARCDAALAKSKLLLEYSCYKLCNAPINAKSLFGNKIKKVAKGNYKASNKGSWRLPQPTQTYNNNKRWLIRLQQRSRDLDSLNRRSLTSLKVRVSPVRPILERTIQRGVETRNSTPPLNKLPHPPQNSEIQPLFTVCLATARYSSGRKVGPLNGTMGRVNRQQMGPLYCSKQFQNTIQVSSSSLGSSSKSESIFLPVITGRDCKTSPKTGSGNGTRSGNSRLLFPAISSTKKEGKVR